MYSTISTMDNWKHKQAQTHFLPLYSQSILSSQTSRTCLFCWTEKVGGVAKGERKGLRLFTFPTIHVPIKNSHLSPRYTISTITKHIWNNPNQYYANLYCFCCAHEFTLRTSITTKFGRGFILNDQTSILNSNTIFENIQNLNNGPATMNTLTLM